MQDLYHQQYFWHDCKVQEAGVRHTLEELPSRAQKKSTYRIQGTEYWGEKYPKSLLITYTL